LTFSKFNHGFLLVQSKDMNNTSLQLNPGYLRSLFFSDILKNLSRILQFSFLNIKISLKFWNTWDTNCREGKDISYHATILKSIKEAFDSISVVSWIFIVNLSHRTCKKVKMIPCSAIWTSYPFRLYNSTPSGSNTKTLHNINYSPFI